MVGFDPRALNTFARHQSDINSKIRVDPHLRLDRHEYRVRATRIYSGNVTSAQYS